MAEYRLQTLQSMKYVPLYGSVLWNPALRTESKKREMPLYGMPQIGKNGISNKYQVKRLRSRSSSLNTEC